jgi:hypothetical protein
MKTIKARSQSRNNHTIALTDVRTPVADKLATLQWLLELDKASQVSIEEPGDGAEVCLPVRTVVKWTTPIQSGSFRASLGPADVTSEFTVDEAGQIATASGETRS